MKFLFAILFLLIMSFPAFSQGAFYLKHNVTHSNDAYDITECEKGYLFAGVSERAGMLCYGYLLFLNHDGDIIWEKISPDYLPDNYRQYITAVYRDNYFYIGGTVRIEEKKYSTLTKIDMEGNIIFEKTFGSAGVLGFDNITRKMLLNDDGILLASSGFNGYGTKGELVQLDFEGNILWNHKFFSYDLVSKGYWEYFEDMKKGKDGNFILALSSNANHLDFTYYSIIKVTPDGEELWRKVFDTQTPSTLTNDTLRFKSATPYKGNHVLACFSVVSVPQIGFRRDIVLIEYDEHGNEIDYKRFYNPGTFGYTNISINQTDEIFIAGARDFEDSTRLSIIKMDANKEIEWNKYYYKENSAVINPAWSATDEAFHCGIPASDDGFILSGVGFYMIGNDFYWNSTIIKTDCEGNTVWDYSRCASPEFEDITIFPNPSSDNFIIQLPDLQEKDKIQIAVYDVMGKLVQLSEHSAKGVITLNSSIWAEGTYICRITVNNEAVKTEKLLKIDGM